VRCTVGEISDALERAWGRHAASSGVAPGYYVTEREAAATGALSVKCCNEKHARWQASTVCYQVGDV